MKYVSIDIETTGLDPETCQIIEFAAVIEDTSRPDVPVEKLPHFKCLVFHEKVVGEHYAIHLNAGKILDSFLDSSACTPEDVLIKFRGFLMKNGFESDREGIFVKFTAAGKNFSSFDLQFLKRLPYWDLRLKAKSRVLDPTSLYFDPETDEELPSLETCKQRAGLEGAVKHDALEDARDVIRVIRKYYHKNQPTG